MWLENKARNTIINETTVKKQEKAYDALIEIMEDYYQKILSTKVYWDDLEAKEQFKIFWNKYNEIKKIDEASEKEKQKLILFLKDDLVKLNNNSRNNAKIIKMHKNYLVSLGAMKNMKNKCKSWQTSLKGEKRIWNTQK